MDRPANAARWLSRIGFLPLCLVALAAAAAPDSKSVFLSAPAEPRAITVQGKGDGRADDSDALQHAIDQAAEKPGGGLVFLPSGRYRITRTLLVWPAVRIFGIGATRPALVLGDHTPGFQQGVGSMVVFAGARRGENARGNLGVLDLPRVPFPPPTVVPFDPKVWDASSSSFYSAMSNIDIEIGAGNPAATGIRFRMAQHAFLTHMSFTLRSGFAGIYQAGNWVSDLHFHGGRYGIVTEKTSPAWQFTVLDSSFDGQSGAAIREHEAQLTLVNVAMRNVPVGIEIDRGYGDWLWGKDVRFEHVRQAGIIISNENNAHTEVGFENALASDTPVLARLRDSGQTINGKGHAYRVSAFSHGLDVPGLSPLGQLGRFATNADITAIEALPAPRAPALRPLPPVAEWANVHDLGVSGDGKTDDTQALQHAIDTHRVVYLPLGVYKVSDTIRLRPDSVLIGLHPSLTQIQIRDDTPAFQGVGEPKALVQSAQGGDALIFGVGLLTGGINPRAVALLWSAGEHSEINDVKLEPGPSNQTPNGARVSPFDNYSAEGNPARRWDGQYPSLWVRQGGGTINGIWSPDTFASAGLYVSDTTVPGHCYEISVEHHVRNEIVLDRVANWELLAPQTEEEYRESRNAVSLEIRDSHDLLIANYHAYRVTRTTGPAPSAVRLYGSHDIHFRNIQVNAESGFATCDEEGCATYLRVNKFPNPNAIEDVPRGLTVREREFARLDISAQPPAEAPGASPTSPTWLKGVVVRRLAGGFEALGGGTIDHHGTLYFADRNFERIYSWSQAQGLKLVSSHPLDADNLAVDASGKLLVLSSAGYAASVYSLQPDGLDGPLTRIEASPAGAHPNATVAIPAVWWVNAEFKDQYDPARDHFTTLAELFEQDAATAPAHEYASPDGTLVLPAYRVFHQGPPDNRGWRFSHSLDTHGFILAKPGSRIYVSNASEAKTYSALVGPKGALQDLKVFAGRGGESVTSDAAGRVYVANGEIFVYDPNGHELGTIAVPERPLQLLASAGPHPVLLILTHHTLYSAELGAAENGKGAQDSSAN